MSNSISLFTKRITKRIIKGALISALVLPAFVGAQQQNNVRESTNPSTRSGPEPTAPIRSSANKAATISTADIERELAEALTIVEDKYVDGIKINYNSLFKSAITGMLRALDPHSNYLDAEDYDKFRTEQRSEYYGIGAAIGDLRLGDKVDTYIRATFQNSPAARAGLRYGDRIVDVDGQSMRGKPYFEVRKNLLGARGSIVKVTIEQAATNSVKTVEITRDAVPQPSIPSAYIIKPGVGYVAMIGGFNQTTAEEFEAALTDLRVKGMNTLILDLRGNRGGLLVQSVRIVNTFLQRGQLILTQKGRVRGSSQTFVADNDNPDATPLVVLIDRGSASASEIVAGALQDHDRAVIVGEASFGKGLVQAPVQLNYGSALLLTIAKYYTPSGRLIQRDYANGGLYDYYSRGASSGAAKPAEPPRPTGPATRTAAGRVVYGGGGIAPDETVEPRQLTPAQQRLSYPVFAFARQLVGGHIKGFERYKVEQPIDYDYVLKEQDLVVTPALYKRFKEYVAGNNPVYNWTEAQLNREQAFIERQLRYELATASYGTVTAVQVYNADDPQVLRAIHVLPQARTLAHAALRSAAATAR